MIGYQSPTGRVLIFKGDKFEEVEMLRKGALVEYIKRKKLSASTLEKLEKQINSEEKPKRNLEEKKTVPTSTKKVSVPKQMKISEVPNSAAYVYGQVVIFQNGYKYKKGRTYWTLVK